MTGPRWARRAPAPVLAITVVLVTIAVAVLLLAVFAVRATEQARTAAARADQATTCNGLLLQAIALRAVPDAARAQGCDTRPAQIVIDRSRERDTAARQTAAALVDEARKRAALERQLVALGEVPVTMPDPAPEVTVVVPRTPTTSPRPAPSSPRPTPTAPRPPTPRPSPTPTPSAPGLLDPLLCGLLRC